MMADLGRARYWKDPSFAIFSKSRSFGDIKYDTERSLTLVDHVGTTTGPLLLSLDPSIDFFAWFHIVCHRYASKKVHFTCFNTILALSLSSPCRTQLLPSSDFMSYIIIYNYMIIHLSSSAAGNSSQIFNLSVHSFQNLIDVFLIKILRNGKNFI